jgi:ribosomal subunit interface protein
MRELCASAYILLDSPVMKLPIQITFHGAPVSDSLTQYIRRRAEKLTRFDPHVMGCRVAVEVPQRHTHRGAHYSVRIDLAVSGGDVVVKRIPKGDHAYEDLYVAVNDAFEDVARRLQDFVRRRRGDVKFHERRRRSP